MQTKIFLVSVGSFFGYNPCLFGSRNPCNFRFAFWEKWWLHKFILNLTNLTQRCVTSSETKLSPSETSLHSRIPMMIWQKNCWFLTSLDDKIFKSFWKPNAWMNFLEKNSVISFFTVSTWSSFVGFGMVFPHLILRFFLGLVSCGTRVPDLVLSSGEPVLHLFVCLLVILFVPLFFILFGLYLLSFAFTGLLARSP